MKIIYRSLSINPPSSPSEEMKQLGILLTSHNIQSTSLNLPARSLVAGESDRLVIVSGHFDEASQLFETGEKLHEQSRSVLFVKEALSIGDENPFGNGRTEIFSALEVRGFQCVTLEELSALLEAKTVFVYAAPSLTSIGARPNKLWVS